MIPAAEKYLGSPVKEIKAFGTFQCRNVADTDKLSEHAYAKAADIASFVLADGREISVLDDFYGKDAKGGKAAAGKAAAGKAAPAAKPAAKK